MSKTYGSVTYDREREQWVFTTQPDVTMRLKRIFPRVQTESRSPSIRIADGIEVARDILWVLDRWALEVSPADLARLRRGGKEFEARGERVTTVLTGSGKHVDLPLEPSVLRAPREYQREAHDLLEATGGLLVADDLGLGKTVTGLLALSDPRNRPMLAVTLAGTLPRQWVRECNAMYPDLYAVEAMTGTPYDLRDEDGNEPDLIVMNYAKLAKWADHLYSKVNSVVFDEVHELRHSGTQKHNAATLVSSAARLVTGLSATPVYNKGEDIFPIYQVLRPGLLGDRSEFLREWCQVDGMKARIEDPLAFRQWLLDQGAFIRRTTRDVGIEIPPCKPVSFHIDVDPAKWDALAADSDIMQVAALVLDQSATVSDRWRARGELDYRMRHQTGVLKAPYVADVARLVLETEEKIILAGWHRDVWAIWQERLADFKPVLYTGSETTAGKRRSFDAFESGDSRIFMLSLRSGAGMDGLQYINCQTAIFGEYDWAPGVHTQVLGRLSRPGQDRPVMGLFCNTDYGADPLMLDALDLKEMEAQMLVQGGSASERGVFAPSATPNNSLTEMAEQMLARGKGK